MINDKEIKDTDLLELGFKMVSDDFYPDDKFYGLAIQDMADSINISYSFTTNNIIEGVPFTVYAIGYGRFKNDVNLPIKKIDDLATIIFVCAEKSMKIKIF